jgi:peptide/nickel transport system substrate-binding protein
MPAGDNVRSIARGRNALGRVILVLAFAAAAGVIAAGAGFGSTGAAPKRGKSITLGITVPPVSLNPAKVGPGAQVAFLSPLYDSYIYQAADGSYHPGLAKSFGYANGSHNSTFEMTIRSGLKFADGTPLNARVVRDNLRYQRDSGFATSGFLKPFKTITASGSKVTIVMSRPVAGVPLLFSQFYPSGFPVSEAGLQNPKQLDTQSFGIGPYVVDSGATVPGSTYTYVANPKYYDQSKIHYNKMVIRVISDSNALLQALKTGQIDVMAGSAQTVAEARSAGINIYSAPARNVALWLIDRSGAASKPFGDLRVRQALNYAVDRKAITKAIVGTYGTPTDQPANLGQDGYDPALEKAYPYNTTKSKQLLTAAGYPSGFSVTIVTVTPGQKQAEAIAGYWGNVGVKTSIVTDDTFRAELSGKYPAFLLSYAGNLAVLLNLAVLPTAPANVFHSTNPQLQAMLNQYGVLNAANTGKVAKQISKFLVDNAWFLPLYDEHAIWFARPNVAGVKVTPAWTFLDPKEWFPKS